MVRGHRPRYIALRAPGAPTHALEQACLVALRAALGGREVERVRARLFHLRPGTAIARVDHRTQAASLLALNTVRLPGGIAVTTVATSGTLRQAKAALGVLTATRRRRPRHATSRTTTDAPPRAKAEASRTGRSQGGARSSKGPTKRDSRPANS